MTAEQELEKDLSNYKDKSMELYDKYFITQTELDEDKALSLENAQF